jgi:hypothetical protein
MSFLNGLAEIFRDSALSALGAGFQAMEDPQSFLKDDLPADASPVAKWIQSRNRRACRRHARNEAAGAYSNLGVLRRPRYERVCRPYLDSINEGPEAEGSYGPEWGGAGGQCDGKLYGSSITFRTGFVNTQGQIVWGSVQTANANCGVPGVNLTGPVSFSVTTSGNQKFYRFVGKNNTFGASVSVSTSTPFQLLGTSLTLCSGQGTEAGCPPPDNQYKPPRYPTNLPPIGPPDTDNPPPGGDGEDDVEVDDDGNIRICENGDCSSPTSPGGGGDPSEDPGEEDGDPQENDPNNPQDGDITGCAEDGKILTGIKIEITQTPPAEVPGAGGLYRKVCWVWMGPSQDQLDLVADGRYLENGQFVIPDSNNCRCYKVRPSPLWGLSVQAFSRPEKED